MNNVEFGKLDTKKEKEIIEYENALFKAFSPTKNWISTKYQLIDSNRLKSNIPYEYLEIYTIRENGKLVSASAVNTNMSQFCQIEEMGYDLNKILKIDKSNICEGIGFFVLDTKINRFEIGNYTTTNVFREMKKRGFLEYYGTSDKDIVKLYTKLFDFKQIDSFFAGDFEKCLLKVELSTIE